MPSTPAAKDPVVLSYAALRRAVGIVALALPFATALPTWILCQQQLIGSISGSYYTETRNIFVGSLCAISMFMLCCRGYDWKDEAAGIFSAICALGVAFCPTSPDQCATPHQDQVAVIHYIFATLLFSTLAYFCLKLFRTTAHNRTVTPKKRQRNHVYSVCGWVIVGSMAILGVLALLGAYNTFGIDKWIAKLHTTLIFEATSLFAFGIAWLVKGEALPFLNDDLQTPTHTRTTDKLFGFSTPAEHLAPNPGIAAPTSPPT